MSALLRPAWARAAAGPLLLAVLGGILLARGHGLWYDELFTAEVAPLPIGELVASIVSGRGTLSYLPDVPPSYNAPYYLAMHLYLLVPGTDGALGLRLPSLVAGAAAVAVLGRVAARLAGDRPWAPRAEVVVGLSVAANPLVVQQAVEARSYGLAMLATALAALGLVRWLDGEPRALLLFGGAATAMGLAHWFCLPALAGLVAAAVALRGRAALHLAVVATLASLPTLALVGLAVANGTGSRNTTHLRDTGGRLIPLAASQGWADGSLVLLVLTLGCAALALLRRSRAATVAACWVAVPLLLLSAAERLQPVYLPRYLLPALLGLGVLAAVGAAGERRRVAVPLSVLLVGGALWATVPGLAREPKESADLVVRLLADRQRPGEPVVAVDVRSALGLQHYVPVLAPRLRADLRLPPADPPLTAGVVWLVRETFMGAVAPSEDEQLLRAGGLRLTGQSALPGSQTDLLVQRYAR